LRPAVTRHHSQSARQKLMVFELNTWF